MNMSQHMKGRGYLKLILGPMWAGKSSEGMRLARIFNIAKWKCLCVKYKKDARYDADAITSHDQMKMPAETATDLVDIVKKYSNKDGFFQFDCLLIDEFQFLNEETTFDTVMKLKAQGVYIICCGLDLSAARKWYKNSRDLFEEKDDAIFLKAWCMNCNNAEASFTWSASNRTGKNIIGGLDMYMPVCGHCYNLLCHENHVAN
jgi:thymidine kinase